MNLTSRTIFKSLRIAAIWIASGAVVFAVSWFAPSLSNAATNILFRLRGELPAPENIVIVAIDDASLQRIGKYPWSRRIIAQGLDKISAGNPQAVGIDVIYAEESDAEDDATLAAAIKRNGRVVLPAQLYENVSETNQKEVDWLKPLSEFAVSSAGVGHAHAAPDVDGTLRSVQLSKSDDAGTRLWAFGLEILRVAENIRADDYEETPDALRFGSYKIKLFPDDTDKSDTPGVALVRPNEMLINYLGTPQTFRYYSFADVLSGSVSPETFNGKIVLLGATSPTLGDAQVTPFIHYASANDADGGQAMPGVEVHANIINTIRNRLWLAFPPQSFDFGLILLIVLSVTLIVKFLDGWLQIAALILIFAGIVWSSLIAFNNYFLIFPLPEMLTAYLVAVPLLLANRSLAASRDLDFKLHYLADVQNDFLPDADDATGRRRNRIVPRNLEWKLRAVDEITARLLSRMSFINRVLTGMNEGVIVTDVSMQAVFANYFLTAMFGVKAQELIGRNVADFFRARGILTDVDLLQIAGKILSGENYEKEFEIENRGKKFYLARFSPVTAGDETNFEQFENTKADAAQKVSSAVIGILILISDLTEQRELDRLKAETVQLVSHELRAPLTSIQALSDVLQKFSVPADESQEMLATIHSESVRLNNLINRFLDIKRLESFVQELQISDFDVDELLEKSAARVTAAAAEKKIKIRLLENKNAVTLRADAQLIEQAIGNLLSNAVKYSPPETTVNIESVTTANELQIIVRDKGYGIPAEFTTRIFDSFYRLKRDADSGIVGTGLGLSLVKEIAERHGGRVTLDSRQNVGSTFIIHLPR